MSPAPGVSGGWSSDGGPQEDRQEGQVHVDLHPQPGGGRRLPGQHGNEVPTSEGDAEGGNQGEAAVCRGDLRATGTLIQQVIAECGGWPWHLF